jgi:hypothetical protein
VRHDTLAGVEGLKGLGPHTQTALAPRAMIDQVTGILQVILAAMGVTIAANSYPRRGIRR